jgi:hypothetical protein
MSYPEPRYLGDTGELTATYRPDGHEPELSNPTGNSVHYLATGASTAGEFGLYRWEMGPHPSGPDPHFHKTISESFYILSGAMRLYDGQRWIGRVARRLPVRPRRRDPRVRNESGEPASMLLLFAPGAPREDYFETLADSVRRDALTEEERAEFFLRHDTYWV